MNASVTWRRAWFWRISSLLSLLDSFSFLLRWCHVKTSNVISDFITVEYTWWAFAKIASHIKTLSQLNVSILMTWFVLIWWRCASHCSFMFSWTLRTRTSDFDLMIDSSMCMLIIMSNFFYFLIKWVNSYFFDANVTSWVQAHLLQTSCILFSIMQISSMNLL